MKSDETVLQWIHLFSTKEVAIKEKELEPEESIKEEVEPESPSI